MTIASDLDCRLGHAPSCRCRTLTHVRTATVSVVIPVYNVAAYLKECLHSVLDDADSGVELICVDDGSTDRSGEMLDELACGVHESAVKVIHQANAGVGAARNAALDAATGDWIMFLDGDDMFAKGWSAAVRTLAVRHPDAQMLGFGLAGPHLGPAMAVGESREVDVSRVIGYDVYGRGMYQFAYRREVIAGIRFEGTVRGEDKLFQGDSLLKATRVALVDVPLYGYRRRDGSAMRSRWNRRNFAAELAWRTKWLKRMTFAGRTMDWRLWWYIGMCLLKYVSFNLYKLRDRALTDEMESLWFETLLKASEYPFAMWQRLAMRIVGTTRSRTLGSLLGHLPIPVDPNLGRFLHGGCND